MRRLGPPLIACIVLSVAPAHAADVSWVLELPLTQGQAAVQSVVQAHGGSIAGGSFSAQGWTTTSRGDSIEVALPAGIDARRGVLTLTFTQPELPGPTGYFESYILLSLDRTGVPFKPTVTGQAGIQSMYIAWNELDQPLKKLKGYFNLFDPGCSDWHLCTGETSSQNGWLGDGSGTYTIVHTWGGAFDQVHMEGGNGNVNKNINLSSSSPTGIIHAAQLYLSVNPCGGSNNNACGLWDGPHHGGPLDTTYVGARIELLADCGDGDCSAQIEDCQICAVDCCGGSGGSGGGAQGGAGQGGAAQGGQGADGGTVDTGGAGSGAQGGGGSASSSSSSSGSGTKPPSSGSSGLEGGCALSHSRKAAWPWLALACSLAWGLRRRRAKAV